MKLCKQDIVLFAIYLIDCHGLPNMEYTKEHLSNAIGISETTLDLYLTRLKTDGLLVRRKRKYVHDLRKTIEVTEKGSGNIGELSRTIDHLLLTEQRHNIPACIELTKIMAQLPNPLEKIFFLSTYNQSKYFDLPMLLDSLMLSKEDTNLLNALCEERPGSNNKSMESFIESFFNASLYGSIDPEILQTDVWPKENINSLILLAQAKIRSNHFEDAKMIHEYILTSRTDMTHNQWFITKVGCIQWLIKKGDLDGALSSVDEILSSIDDKVMQAFARLLKGQILFQSNRHEEAMDLLRSAISSFTTFGLPLFLSIAHNERGVYHLIRGSYQEAEKDLLKARRYANEAKSEYSEAKVLPNLADIAIRKGNYNLSKSLLYKAAGVFLKYNDYEDLNIVEGKLDLLKVLMKEVNTADEQFKRYIEIAPQYPPNLI